MKLKINFTQARAILAGYINSLNLLGGIVLEGKKTLSDNRRNTVKQQHNNISVVNCTIFDN